MDKLCPRCGIIKDSEKDFNKDRARKGGIRTPCKECLQKDRVKNRDESMKKNKDKRTQVIRLLTLNAGEYITCDFDSGTLYKKGSGEPLPAKIHPKGYYIVSLLGCSFRAHRLIWLLKYGEWPEYVDHIDGDVQNNSISNLRNCNNNENQCNQRAHRDGKLPGCYFHTCTGKWNVQFHEKGVHKYLGLYTTEREASLVYCRYVLKHNLIRREFLPSIFTDEELYGEVID